MSDRSYTDDLRAALTVALSYVRTLQESYPSETGGLDLRNIVRNIEDLLERPLSSEALSSETLDAICDAHAIPAEEHGQRIPTEARVDRLLTRMNTECEDWAQRHTDFVMAVEGRRGEPFFFDTDPKTGVVEEEDKAVLSYIDSLRTENGHYSEALIGVARVLEIDAEDLPTLGHIVAAVREERSQREAAQREVEDLKASQAPLWDARRDISRIAAALEAGSPPEAAALESARLLLREAEAERDEFRTQLAAAETNWARAEEEHFQVLCEETDERRRADAKVERLTRERDALAELLAVMCGDGGHRIDEVGWKKTVEECIDKHYELLKDARAKVERLSAAHGYEQKRAEKAERERDAFREGLARSDKMLAEAGSALAHAQAVADESDVSVSSVIANWRLVLIGNAERERDEARAALAAATEQNRALREALESCRDVMVFSGRDWPQRDGGLASITGQWPGDEDDEQFARALGSVPPAGDERSLPKIAVEDLPEYLPVDEEGNLWAGDRIIAKAGEVFPPPTPPFGVCGHCGRGSAPHPVVKVVRNEDSSALLALKMLVKDPKDSRAWCAAEAALKSAAGEADLNEGEIAALVAAGEEEERQAVAERETALTEEFGGPRYCSDCDGRLVYVKRGAGRWVCPYCVTVELDQCREDLTAAAGELLVDVPAPGTEKAQLLLANRKMRRQLGEALEAREEAINAHADDIERLVAANRRADDLEKEHTRLTAIEAASRALLEAAHSWTALTSRWEEGFDPDEEHDEAAREAARINIIEHRGNSFLDTWVEFSKALSDAAVSVPPGLGSGASNARAVRAECRSAADGAYPRPYTDSELERRRKDFTERWEEIRRNGGGAGIDIAEVSRELRWLATYDELKAVYNEVSSELATEQSQADRVRTERDLVLRGAAAALAAAAGSPHQIAVLKEARALDTEMMFGTKGSQRLAQSRLQDALCRLHRSIQKPPKNDSA